jgi:repressor of nif and glnA expression
VLCDYSGAAITEKALNVRAQLGIVVKGGVEEILPLQRYRLGIEIEAHSSRQQQF